MFKFLKEKIGGWIKSFKGGKKPVKKEKIVKKQSDDWGDISDEERQRREKNRALKALGPKN